MQLIRNAIKVGKAKARADFKAFQLASRLKVAKEEANRLKAEKEARPKADVQVCDDSDIDPSLSV